MRKNATQEAAGKQVNADCESLPEHQSLSSHDNLDEYSPRQIAGMVDANIISPDPETADRIIRIFHRKFQQVSGADFFDTRLNSEEIAFLKHVEHAFRLYVEGKEPARGKKLDGKGLPITTAFGLKANKGRRSQGLELRNLGIAALVESELRKEMERRGISERRSKARRDGSDDIQSERTIKMEPIYNDVVNTLGGQDPPIRIGWSSVEGIYTEFESGVESMDSGVLSLLATNLLK